MSAVTADVPLPRAWAFVLDGPDGRVVSRRPFLHTMHAVDWALMVRERYGLHRDAVRVLGGGAACCR